MHGAAPAFLINDMAAESKRIGTRHFVDGVELSVYRDVDGRQYVLDDQDRVYGVWLPGEDESDTAIIVPANRSNPQ